MLALSGTPLASVAIAFLLAIVLALVWYYTIKLTATGFINVKQYLGIFLILIPTMVLIITVIKSSLALSLGLVGALSIVRFRTPIKDPAELMYIFVAIAVGLALGAGQTILTVFFMAVICFVLIVHSKFRTKSDPNSKGMLLEITVSNQSALPSTEVLAILNANQMKADLRRLSSSEEAGVYVFKVTATTAELMENAIEQIRQKDGKSMVTFFNNERIVA